MSLHKIWNKTKSKRTTTKKKKSGILLRLKWDIFFFVRYFLFMDNSNHFLRLRSTGEHQRWTLKLLNQRTAYPFTKKEPENKTAKYLLSKANSFWSWVSNVFPFFFSFFKQTTHRVDRVFVNEKRSAMQKQVSNVSQTKLI